MPKKSLFFYKNELWKKKDVTAENPCFSTKINLGRKKMVTIISKNDCGLYGDDGLMIQEYINGQQIDQLRKKVIKTFKEIGFKSEIEKKLKNC